MPDLRLKAIAAANFRSVWRALRRFGVHSATLDDAMQQVLTTASVKLDQIESGKERAFLLGIAYRVAANVRRAQVRRAEVPLEEIEMRAHTDPNPEELLELKHRRALLDEALDALSQEHRAVFVLFELEGCSMTEIAEALELPMGTVASRLRRARARFEGTVGELRKREQGGET